MDIDVMRSFVHLLAKFSELFAGDIKFGKLLLAFVTKYGKQVKYSQLFFWDLYMRWVLTMLSCH